MESPRKPETKHRMFVDSNNALYPKNSLSIITLIAHFKMSKGHKFSKKIHVANMHMKRCLPSLTNMKI